MPFRRRPFPRKITTRISSQAIKRVKVIFISVLSLFSIVHLSLYLREISSQMAISDAQDIVILAINDAINTVMTENGYDYEHFVKLEKDAEGNITAITTNMTNINALSTMILSEVVDASNEGELDVRIPLGNLLGSNLLLGRGPDIPVDIIMLTSSFVEFENEFVSAGINQAKHRLILKIDVDIDILIPWELITTRVETDVIIAETVVVGRVPSTYVDLKQD